MIKSNRAVPVWYNYIFNVGLALWSLAMIGIGGYLVNSNHSTLSIVFLSISCFYAVTAFLGLGLRHMFGRAGFPIWITCLGLMTIFQAVIIALFAARQYQSHAKVNRMDRHGTDSPKLSTFLRNNHEALLGVLGTGLGLMVLDFIAAVWMKMPNDAYNANKAGNVRNINVMPSHYNAGAGAHSNELPVYADNVNIRVNKDGAVNMASARRGQDEIMI